MGYYSDVALAQTKGGSQALKQKLASKSVPAKTREDVPYLLEHAEKHLCDSETEAECWKWDTIKWYEFEPNWFTHINLTVFNKVQII